MKILIRATDKSTWRLESASELTVGQNITLTDGTKLTVERIIFDNFPDKPIPVQGTVA